MKLKEKNLFTGLLLLSFLLEGLDAFAILSIPFSWIGIALLLTAIPLSYLLGINVMSSNFSSIKYWIFYIFLVTILRSLAFNLDIPQYATTNYYQYVSLRLIKIVSFFIAIWLVHVISIYLTKRKIIEYVAYIGILISILSLYSYFSYFLNFPDFIRTRPGSGGWTQPIDRACSILRNYGTFREPSFLAVWTVPFIPITYYLARKNYKWYFFSIFPILSLVLTRSLTGVVSLLLAFALIFFISLVRAKKVDYLLLVPILAILLTSLFSSNISYTFPPLDPSMCPPNSADKCDCSIYDDELDEAKNTQNIAESIFSRASLLLKGGIDGFGNFPYLIEHLTNLGVKFFGDGLGSANIIYSYEFEELSSQLISDEKVFRNPGQIVSFNNLYAYVYFSGGLIALVWFSYIVLSALLKVVLSREIVDTYLAILLLSILLMFFFQAEEPSIALGFAIGLIGLNRK